MNNIDHGRNYRIPDLAVVVLVVSRSDLGAFFQGRVLTAHSVAPSFVCGVVRKHNPSS